MTLSVWSILIRFQVKKKQFFRNFMTIMLFGAVGTLISFCIISLGNISTFEYCVPLYCLDVYKSLAKE